ncbi:MAG: hypothetical protein RR235_07860, partial [Oscillospiraceae bacterium]
MAKMTFKAGDEYARKLSSLVGAQQQEIIGAAIYEGAKIVADAIRASISALPVEEFRVLKDGDQFNALTPTQKKDLLSSYGVTPMTTDANGDSNVHVGFDGYGKYPSKKYPLGLPNELLARSVESGSSVRKKTPFVGPVIRATKGPATKR